MHSKGFCRSWIRIVAVASSVAAATPILAAPRCIGIEAVAPQTVCAGQPATVSGSISNSCSSAQSATLVVSLDGRSKLGEASVTVPADSITQAQVGITVPAATPPGPHTLTVGARDASGREVSSSVEVTVTTCGGALGAPAQAGCVSIRASASPSTVCAGGTITAEESITNSCSSQALVSLTLAMDGKTVPSTVQVDVPAGGALQSRQAIPVPPTLPPGDHTLTIVGTDASGAQATAEVAVTITPCGR